MLLAISDKPFSLLCNVAITICLGHRMAYSAMHGLKESRIRFITIIDHKEMPGERGPIVKDPSLVIQAQLSLQQFPCSFYLWV
jgi:hypothetical protein